MTQAVVPTTSQLTPIFKHDPISWQIWYLEQNLHLYHEFRRRADDHARVSKTVRANRIIMELRFETQLHGNDAFKINDHANLFFIRVYKLKRPDVEVEIQKKGYWKNLSQEDRNRILVPVSRLKKAGRL